MTMIMIAVPCAWAAAVLCIANVVRLLTSRDITPKLRYGLLAANLGFPLAFGAFILLP